MDKNYKIPETLENKQVSQNPEIVDEMTEETVDSTEQPTIPPEDENINQTTEDEKQVKKSNLKLKIAAAAIAAVVGSAAFAMGNNKDTVATTIPSTSPNQSGESNSDLNELEEPILNELPDNVNTEVNNKDSILEHIDVEGWYDDDLMELINNEIQTSEYTNDIEKYIKNTEEGPILEGDIFLKSIDTDSFIVGEYGRVTKQYEYNGKKYKTGAEMFPWECIVPDTGNTVNGSFARDGSEVDVIDEGFAVGEGFAEMDMKRKLVASVKGLKKSSNNLSYGIITVESGLKGIYGCGKINYSGIPVWSFLFIEENEFRNCVSVNYIFPGNNSAPMYSEQTNLDTITPEQCLVTIQSLALSESWYDAAVEEEKQKEAEMEKATAPSENSVTFINDDGITVNAILDEELGLNYWKGDDGLYYIYDENYDVYASVMGY